MEFNEKKSVNTSQPITKDFPVLGIKSTDSLDTILEAISHKFKVISEEISLVDTYYNTFDQAISSNKFTVKLIPSDKDITLEYDLEGVGKGRFMRAKFSVYSTNEYGTEYSVFESSYLKSSAILSPYMFPLTVYIQYREVLESREIEYTKSFQITGVNETIEDRLHSLGSTDNKRVKLKDKIKLLDSDVNFLINRSL